MPDLVKLQDGDCSQWKDIRIATHMLWRASLHANTDELRADLRLAYNDPELTVLDLHTGINSSRRGILVSSKERITVAFEGSGQYDLIKNLWTDAKGPWGWSYPVYENGGRVHSFYRDMWCAMRSAAFAGIENAIGMLVEKGKKPKSIIVFGYSMGGGVSTMAITNIVEHIRGTYGSSSHSCQEWAADENLRCLVQHLTVAAMAAGDEGFHTVLNHLYERHQIRAWDIMNYIDRTRNFHDFRFRSWRGHRYILPDAVVGQYRSGFGDQGHSILGYLQSFEWLEENATDVVRSEYSY